MIDPPVRYSEAAFIEDLGETPANYRRIERVNGGPEPLGEESARLELGPNNCAANSRSSRTGRPSLSVSPTERPSIADQLPRTAASSPIVSSTRS